MAKTLTLSDVRATLHSYGLVISKRGDEYRVSFRLWPTEATAYYTDDLEDALQTGLYMARERR